MQATTGRHNESINTNLPYLLYLPDDYDNQSEKQWPLILFLHGAGERGSNLDLVRSQGLPKKLENGGTVPFIVIAPQCPVEDWWSDYRETVMGLVHSTRRSYHVDQARIYITGLSMGGRGTWDFATQFPDQFAAAAPICGWGDGLFGYPDRLRRITHIPVWAFHGDLDELVPVKGAEWLVDALNEYGGSAKFTVYPGVGHDSWTETYDNPELYDWFLKHKLD